MAVGGTYRAIIWAAGLGALAAVLMYFLSLGISALLGYSAGGEMLAGQLLGQFGYTNASKIITAGGLQAFYQAQVVPYILTLLGFTIGAIVGYFKGKKEDKEEEEKAVAQTSQQK